MIFVNFKIYKESWGDGALRLAEVCKKVMEKSGVKIFPVVAALDVYRITKEVGIKVYIQHTDGMIEGAKTGYVSTEQAIMNGAVGALINHSEHRLKPGTIKKRLSSWPSEFKSIACIQTIGQT